jgi:hypothetical protein
MDGLSWDDSSLLATTLLLYIKTYAKKKTEIGWSFTWSFTDPSQALSWRSIAREPLRCWSVLLLKEALPFTIHYNTNRNKINTGGSCAILLNLWWPFDKSIESGEPTCTEIPHHCTRLTSSLANTLTITAQCKPPASAWGEETNNIRSQNFVNLGVHKFSEIYERPPHSRGQKDGMKQVQ